MQTKITFAGGTIDLDTFHHENMHQWWGDNVSEANYNLTFFKEGLATLGEFFFAARNAQAAAGGPGTPAGDAAFEQSLVDSFNSTYANTALNWTGAPSDPRPYSLFSGSSTYDRPGIAYIALRRILGPANFAAALQQIQRTYRQGSITEAQLEAGFKAFLPVSDSCVQREAESVLHAVVRHRLPGGRRREQAADHRAGARRGRLPVQLKRVTVVVVVCLALAAPAAASAPLSGVFGTTIRGATPAALNASGPSASLRTAPTRSTGTTTPS